MSFLQELSSWRTPASLPTSPAPALGAQAPSTEKLRVPAEDGRPMVIAFLRHCGCPFAEATFLNLRARATENPDVAFVAVSHSNPQHTQKWLSEVGGPGSVNPVQVIIDESRETYAKWGLGVSSFAHVLSPAGLKAVRTLGKEKGIWNRPTESGSRWQTGGCFGVDKAGRVVWGGVSGRADEMPTFEEAVVAVKAGGSASASARL